MQNWYVTPMRQSYLCSSNHKGKSALMLSFAWELEQQLHGLGMFSCLPIFISLSLETYITSFFFSFFTKIVEIILVVV